MVLQFNTLAILCRFRYNKLMNVKLKIKDILLIIVILGLAGILSLIRQSGIGSTQNARLRITVEGTIYGEYRLDENQEITINDTNVCRIADGVVSMIRSTCPDHLCEHQRSVDLRGGSIICLPNRVVLEIVEDENEGIDAIAS